MNNGPTLATLVKKWLRTYSTKSQWEFRYANDPKTQEQVLDEGYLTCNRFIGTPNQPTIKIKDDTAVIGQLGTGNYWEGRTWQESIHSSVKLIAADPRFFAKLDRAMQFLTRSKERRAENERKFAQEEIALLKDVLK